MAPFPFWDGYFHGSPSRAEVLAVRPSFGRKIGWGGRIRTFTVLINSEVSYQLDHAPAGFAWQLRGGPEPAGQACKAMKYVKSIAWSGPSGRVEWDESLHKKGLSRPRSERNRKEMDGGSFSERIATMTRNGDLFWNVQNGCPLR